MANLYLVPVETNAFGDRGPKYFQWPFHPGITPWAGMDYGFLPTMLVHAREITAEEHAALVAHPDVYHFFYALDLAIQPNDSIATFCEGIQIPTDWLTPSNTYLELLRALAGMFQFLQRYSQISGGDVLLDGTLVTLNTRYRNLSTAQQQWFSSTVVSFGYPSALINPNLTLRQMLRSVSSAWGNTPFELGGIRF